MNVYTIKTGFGSSQNHCVVSENMAEAERIFNAKYWPATIKSIELFSSYVQIQKYDEQEKEKQDQAIENKEHTCAYDSDGGKCIICGKYMTDLIELL